MTPQQRLKISRNRKGKDLGNQHGFKKGQVSSWKGKSPTPETREKMRLAKVGKPSSSKGKKMTLEQRERVRQGRFDYLARTVPNYSYESPNDDDRKRVRRARIKRQGGYHSVGEWENLKAQYNWTCPSCHRQEPEIKLTRDHIIPILRGGSDNIENIQPLCIFCNSYKGTSTIKY